jgi:hypothetical protein
MLFAVARAWANVALMRQNLNQQPPAVPEHIRRHRAALARGHREWEVDEICKVIKLYPDYDKMQAALPHRTYAALRNAAKQFAAVRKRHIWTMKENTTLKRLWEAGAAKAELCATFPSVSYRAIKSHAVDMKLGRRGGRRLKEFDATALDKIRQRASDDGHTLVELDRLAGTGRYFQKSNRKIIPKHVVKAIIALGGTWDIDWNDEG